MSNEIKLSGNGDFLSPFEPEGGAVVSEVIDRLVTSAQMKNRSFFLKAGTAATGIITFKVTKNGPESIESVSTEEDYAESFRKLQELWLKRERKE